MSADPVQDPLDMPAGPPTRGTLRYMQGVGRARAVWNIEAAPDVMIRVKRIFPRARATSTGSVAVMDSAEVARDIEWLCERHPLSMDTITRDALTRRAREHRDAEDAVAAILAGARRDTTGMKEPAQTSRDYQQAAADMVTTMKRLLITDELGLGKTHSGLLTLRNPDSLPALVVVPTNLPGQWRRQIETIWPDLTTYVPTKGTPDATFEKWCEAHGAPDVYVVPYSKIVGWQHHLQPVVRSVIFDEVQDLRNGTQTNKGAAAANLAREAAFVVGLTATPVVNYGGDLHSIFDIINPDALGSRPEFLREWGGRQIAAPSGKHHITVSDPQALSLHLRDSGLMLGRTRAEVARELPYGPVEKVPHTVDTDPDVLNRLTGDAVDLARLILSRTAESQQRWRASGELDKRLRQATGIAKAPYVAAFTASLLTSESTDKVVLWGWHRACYDLWEERLAVAGVEAVRYTGGESPAQKDAAVRAFKDPHGPQVLMMSLGSGAGLDGLQEVCHVGVFGELDWSPKVMDQCTGRLARDGQADPVVAYYLLAEDGADPAMAATLDVKQAQAAPIEDPHAAVVTALPSAGERIKALARDLLRQAGVDDAVGGGS